MQRQPVESSNIATVGYDESSQTLEVEFISGSIYQYQNVGENIYDAFIESDSKGKFFNSQIKNAFPYSQVG